jgi:hypothetical protein
MVAFWSTKQESPSEVAGRMDQALAESANGNVESLGDFTQYVPTSREQVLSELEDLAADLDFLAGILSPVVEVEKSKLYKHSRIRVQLSRPLTVAEVEKLTTDHNVIGGRLNVTRREDDGFLVKLRVNPNRTHVWVDADLPSRLLYEVVAAALDSHFVNVYPTAVRTFTEYHA